MLLNRRILFVGGKGGVGKTTVASALALRMAESGKRVLLVSTDPAHSLGDVFDTRIGDTPREIAPNLYAIEIDPDRQVERYLETVKRTMRGFVRPEMYGEIERQIELTRHSPGAAEAALMDEMARLMDDAGRSYDVVVFDTAPTGHTLRLLTLPEIMTAWMDGLLKNRDRSDAFGRAVEKLGGGAGGRSGGSARGSAGGDDLSWFEGAAEPSVDSRAERVREILTARRTSFARARRLLLDRDATAFLFVLIPEKLPILETEKAVRVLEENGVPVAGLVVNRVLPEHSLGDFLEKRRAQEAEYLARIDRTFRAIPRVRIPLLPTDVQGPEALREVGKHLPATD